MLSPALLKGMYMWEKGDTLKNALAHVGVLVSFAEQKSMGNST